MDGLIARGRSKERNSSSNLGSNRDKSKFKRKGKKTNIITVRRKDTRNLIVVGSKKERKIQ